jgi:phospholipid/cholesterol/gamma-HCH transport system substrate-binding protein
MESEARYIRVGIAVLIMAALLAGGLYWLTGGLERQAVKRYVVYFHTQSLEGLQINSDVRMQGIKVGKVADYAIMTGEARKVRVLIEVDVRTPVLEGVVAVVNRHLVTGLAAIDLENGPQGSVPLTRVADGEEYPVIPEGVPQFAKVTSTLEDLGQFGREALSRLTEVLSEQNRKALAGTLDNLNDVTRQLRHTVPELNATLASTHEAADRFSQLSDEADQTLRSTRTHIDRVASETEATLSAARGTLSEINRNVGGLTLKLKMTADLGAQEIQTTAQSLRLAGDTLQETGRVLSDPARILYGANQADLGPGEKTP